MGKQIIGMCALGSMVGVLHCFSLAHPVERGDFKGIKPGARPLVFLRVKECRPGWWYAFGPEKPRPREVYQGGVAFSCGKKSDLKVAVVLGEKSSFFQEPGALIAFRPAPGIYHLIIGNTAIGGIFFKAEDPKGIYYWGELHHGPGTLPEENLRLRDVAMQENTNALARLIEDRISAKPGLSQAWYLWPRGWANWKNKCQPLSSIPALAAGGKKPETVLDYVRDSAAQACPGEKPELSDKFDSEWQGEGKQKKELTWKYLFAFCRNQLYVGGATQEACHRGMAKARSK